MDQRKQAFRSAIAKLKKAGLVSPKIDARKIQPTKSLLAKVKQFSDVIEGRAKSLPTSRLSSRPKDLIEKNYQVSRPRGLPARVIVPHFRDEKVVAKKGMIEYVSDEGLRRIELPKYETGKPLEKYFSELRRTKFPQLPRGAKYGARFFNGRTRTYSSLKDLINKVAGYESVRKAHSKDAQLEIIRNFEIVVTNNQRAWSASKRKPKGRKK